MADGREGVGKISYVDTQTHSRFVRGLCDRNS